MTFEQKFINFSVNNFSIISIVFQQFFRYGRQPSVVATSFEGHHSKQLGWFTQTPTAHQANSSHQRTGQWCIAKNGGGYMQRGVAKGLKVPCLFMIAEVSIRCQKNPGGWYTPYTRVYHPPIHHCMYVSMEHWDGSVAEWLACWTQSQ